MLIGNGARRLEFPGRQVGNADLTACRCAYNKTGMNRNRFQSFSPFCGTPNGHLHPSSWVLPQKSGGLASYTNIRGVGELAPPNLQLIISIFADLTGEGLIDPAPVMQATIPITADLSGAGDFLDSTIEAVGNLSATITPFTGLTPENIASGILDDSFVEGTALTVRQALRLISAALAGKVSGAGTTTVTIRNAVADSKNRIVATVDSNGNRTAITTDVT